MNDRRRRHRHGGRRRGQPDFWRDWREERHRHPGKRGPRGRRERAQQWRAFFQEYMGADAEDHWAFGGRRFSPWRRGMDSFNPLVASMMSKGGGLLPLIVLHLLREQPQYGNALMDQIATLTEGSWIANPGAIYPLINVLEERELVSGKWEDPVKRTVRIYQLTDAGAVELERMEAIMRPKIEQALDVLDSLAIALDGEPNDDNPTEMV